MSIPTRKAKQECKGINKAFSDLFDLIETREETG